MGGRWDKLAESSVDYCGVMKMQVAVIIVKFIINSLWTKMIGYEGSEKTSHPICLADQRTRKVLRDSRNTGPRTSERFKIGVGRVTLGHHDIFLFGTFILTLNIIWIFAWDDNMWDVLSPARSVIYKVAGFVGRVLRHPLNGERGHSKERDQHERSHPVMKRSQLPLPEQKQPSLPSVPSLSSWKKGGEYPTLIWFVE